MYRAPGDVSIPMLYVPDGQKVHACVLLVAAVVLLNVPRGHNLQSDTLSAPVSLLKVPAGHGIQSYMLLSFKKFDLYVPMSHILFKSSHCCLLKFHAASDRGAPCSFWSGSQSVTHGSVQHPGFL